MKLLNNLPDWNLYTNSNKYKVQYAEGTPGSGSVVKEIYRGVHEAIESPIKALKSPIEQYIKETLSYGIIKINDMKVIAVDRRDYFANI